MNYQSSDIQIKYISNEWYEYNSILFNSFPHDQIKY